jgi:hypothetical protein
MALLTVYELGQTAFDITDNEVAADVGLSDIYPNDERTVLIVRNAGGSTCNVTIPKTRDTADKEGFGSLGVDDITAAVLAGETWTVRVPVASHGDAAGRVTVNYDQVTTVWVQALRLARH